MTTDKLLLLLKETGYPVAYDHFMGKKPYPYITFVHSYTNNIFGDDGVREIVDTWQVNLFTLNKDSKAEKKVQAVFDKHKITWNKVSMGYDDKEFYYRTSYDFEELE